MCCLALTPNSWNLSKIDFKIFTSVLDIVYLSTALPCSSKQSKALIFNIDAEKEWFVFSSKAAKISSTVFPSSASCFAQIAISITGAPTWRLS